MRLIFAGTPEFAARALDALVAAGHDIALVLTRADQPAGRGKQLRQSPVKLRALALGIPVAQPRSLRDPAQWPALEAVGAELMVVAAYGLILPQAVLDIPRFGAWNVHASLLPRWRGAAPIQRAIEAGDTQTGVCLMQMEKGLDTGPVLLRADTPISNTDTGGSLHDRLAALGADVLAEGLARLAAGELPSAEPQDAAQATYAHKLDKAEARLDWAQPAALLERRIRAFNPWPVAEVQLDGERLRLHRAAAVDGHGEPGSVLAAGRDGIVVACGEGALRLDVLQRDGGRAIAAADYLNARPGLRR